MWLPGNGGYYDQDEFIMEIWIAIKQLYFRALNDNDFMRTLSNGKSTN